jgi:hypothetical protein
MEKIIMPLLIEDDNFEASKYQAWYQVDVVNFSPTLQDDNSRLSVLVFKILRNPNDLLAHLQRIYFCFWKKWSEHLFAALLDLLAVLAGRGQALARRMIFGCRTALTDDQFLSLKHFLQQESSISLPTNPYAVIASGQLGTNFLISHSQKSQIEYDPINLALDYIEYSQLDDAMTILERSAHQLPERKDIQELLFEIYQSTQSRDRFMAMFQSMNGGSTEQVAGWNLIKNYFDKQSS